MIHHSIAENTVGGQGRNVGRKYSPMNAKADMFFQFCSAPLRCGGETIETLPVVTRISRILHKQ
ncbi:MAG: hypothetical protein L3J88_10990 [Gammaproteobacteria bacterium]|nr:hypothetical protein [Gammaproteobacteria bacterium]MCF6363843.1 hypothetical protein [Gammaproteobacteria bacterium]